MKWGKRHHPNLILTCPLRVNIQDISSYSNSKIFASVKICRRKSKIIELASANVWNTSAIKIPDVNLQYDDKMGGNSTFVLKLVNGSFRIQKYNLRASSFPIAYFKLWEKSVRFFPNNMIAFRDLMVPVQMKSIVIP